MHHPQMPESMQFVPAKKRVTARAHVRTAREVSMFMKMLKPNFALTRFTVRYISQKMAPNKSCITTWQNMQASPQNFIQLNQRLQIPMKLNTPRRTHLRHLTGVTGLRSDSIDVQQTLAGVELCAHVSCCTEVIKPGGHHLQAAAMVLQLTRSGVPDVAS